MGGRIEPSSVLGPLYLARNAVATSDTANLAAGSGINFEPFTYAILDVVLTGSSPTVDITPQFYNTSAATYIDGATRTVASTTDATYTQRLIVEVDNCPDTYFKCTAVAGSTPTVSIYATGLNS